MKTEKEIDKRESEKENKDTIIIKIRSNQIRSYIGYL